MHTHTTSTKSHLLTGQPKCSGTVRAEPDAAILSPFQEQHGPWSDGDLQCFFEDTQKTYRGLLSSLRSSEVPVDIQTHLKTLLTALGEVSLMHFVC